MNCKSHQSGNDTDSKFYSHLERCLCWGNQVATNKCEWRKEIILIVKSSVQEERAEKTNKKYDRMRDLTLVVNERKSRSSCMINQCWSTEHRSRFLENEGRVGEGVKTIMVEEGAQKWSGRRIMLMIIKRNYRSWQIMVLCWQGQGWYLWQKKTSLGHIVTWDLSFSCLGMCSPCLTSFLSSTEIQVHYR